LETHRASSHPIDQLFHWSFWLVIFLEKTCLKTKDFLFSLFLLALSRLVAGYGFLPPTLSYNSISVVAVVCGWHSFSKKELNL